MQVEADLTESAEEGGKACVMSVQADATKPPGGVTTAVLQAPSSLIPLPAKQLAAAAPVKKISIRVATAHAKKS